MTSPTSEQFGPIIITAREIYDAVIRVSAKIDTISLQVATMEADKADHERRLRSLERSRWPLPSVAALVAIAAVVIAFVPH